MQLEDSWFVRPEPVRLQLPGGHFLTVKKQLNAGEERQVFTRQIRAQGLGDTATLNMDQVGKSKLVAYILDWSLVDPDGAPVPFSEEALDNLHPDRYAVIRDAVDAHETAVHAEREARKNGQASESTLSAISPSANSTAGAMSGSIS